MLLPLSLFHQGCKELEAAIESGRFHHDGNPIMTWCIGNVVGKTASGNDDIVRPVKEIPENKIDGAVALMMAIGRIMLNEDDGIFIPDEVLTLWEHFLLIWSVWLDLAHYVPAFIYNMERLKPALSAVGFACYTLFFQHGGVNDFW